MRNEKESQQNKKELMISVERHPPHWSKLDVYALSVNTMRLMLFCVGWLIVIFLTSCESLSSRPTPSVLATPSGNAWAITLPVGTSVIMEDPSQLRAIGVNELEPSTIDHRLSTLLEDCVLVSKSYLLERDERELQLYRIIEEMKIKNSGNP